MLTDRPTSIARRLTFSACADEADFEAVLELRRRTYSAVGKVAAATKASEMADRYDAGAVIVMARDGDTLAATARLVLPEPSELTEYDEFITLPSWVDRGSLAVISRVATHPKFRGGDLLYAICLLPLALAVNHTRRFALGACSSELLPVYARVGAEAAGRQFTYATLATVTDLVVFRPELLMEGRGVRDDLAQSLLPFVQELAGQAQVNRRFRK